MLGSIPGVSYAAEGEGSRALQPGMGKDTGVAGPKDANASDVSAGLQIKNGNVACVDVDVTAREICYMNAVMHLQQ